MDYTHLTLIERGKIALLLSQGAGVQAIGRILGRSVGAISREPGQWPGHRLLGALRVLVCCVRLC
ncbi:helix-turn-helix domain-containing protein [Saccharibacillus brassicae]|uniref:Helix-turn-helix domain-containing protein n=1 Tax=Saccharibacillus brassicae TaxID=2583377 RepID=A0A4Y6UTY5_SACBS|nr:helix-turn-helix domain-containing protein [Saccharibacillus brassicae]